MILNLLLITLGVTIFIWTLVKIKELRESPVDAMPNDETTLMLGMFYMIGRSCVNYHRERKRYPGMISGSRDGLYELGFMTGEPLADKHNLLPLFTVVATERHGYGVCVHNMSPALAQNILDRVEKGGGKVKFVNLKEGELVPLSPPIVERVSMTLPLPLKPGGGPGKSRE